MGNRVGSDGRFGYTNGVDPGECSLNLEIEQLFSLVNQLRPFLFWYILNDPCNEVLLWKSHESVKKKKKPKTQDTPMENSK